MSEKKFLYFGCVFTAIRLPSDKMSGRRQCKLEAMEHLKQDRTCIQRKDIYVSYISLIIRPKEISFSATIFLLLTGIQ